MDRINPLESETWGEILDRATFADIYEDVLQEDRKYYARMDEKGRIDLVLTFKDIEDFSHSTQSEARLEFKRYKNRFLVVVWTVHDPENPLGFPIRFDVMNPDDYKKAELLLEQAIIWIHYLAAEDDQLVHIYSEGVTLSEKERREAKDIFRAINDDTSDRLGEETGELLLLKHEMMLTEDQLTESGIGYSLDFTSLVGKLGETQAQEKVMSAILQAVHLIKNHPRPAARECSFIVWVSETAETTSQGESARLLTIYITPSLEHIFDIVHLHDEEENPFSKLFLSFTEFLAIVQEKPIHRGAYPFIEYSQGIIYHIEPDETLQQRLASLYPPDMNNPYM